VWVQFAVEPLETWYAFADAQRKKTGLESQVLETLVHTLPRGKHPTNIHTCLRGKVFEKKFLLRQNLIWFFFIIIYNYWNFIILARFDHSIAQTLPSTKGKKNMYSLENLFSLNAVYNRWPNKWVGCLETTILAIIAWLSRNSFVFQSLINLIALHQVIKTKQLTVMMRHTLHKTQAFSMLKIRSFFLNSSHQGILFVL